MSHCALVDMAMTVTSVAAARVKEKTPLPLILARVSAGFPSPADDYVEGLLDLNDHLIKNPAATFFIRAEGDSMQGAGIHSGDLLIVDRSLQASDGDVIVASLGGELTVKRVRQKGETLWLVPENSDYEPVEVDIDLHVWGVVTSVIHDVT